MAEIVLASSSKRRSEILSACGIAHRVHPSGSEEISGEAGDITRIVIWNAEKKAEKVAGLFPCEIIIGADTLVVAGDNLIGKPSSEEEAKDILRGFSGGSIEVHTGLCVIDASLGKKTLGSDISRVRVEKIGKHEVERLFSLLGPYDKAGGFSIEGVGSMIFDNIEGSYFNVLGLPMIKLRELFAVIGLDILDHVKI
ncbi:MAG: septum formation protein Maf [Candidatus Omnitrophica bacterium]|nr:septum formation protein Maf [Candidatus Omnitrophota bacterium]